jgi:energy-coupling factor transport system permease protein
LRRASTVTAILGDRLTPDARALDSLLGRTSPLAKLAVAMTWLCGLVVTLDLRAPLFLTTVAVLAGPLLGRIPLRRVLLGVAPLWAAAVGIVFFNSVFSAANTDPLLPEVARLGPWRITAAGLDAGLAVGARVFAIAAVGVLFGQTTDSTRLADALVQQARLSPRFAYGALAAYQAVPRFAEDLVALRQARRIRGLRGGWHPRILVGLLVQAIRHGDRLALAMDARAFGSGPRTTFRTVSWSALDALVAGGGTACLIVALTIARL